MVITETSAFYADYSDPDAIRVGGRLFHGGIKLF